MARNPDRESVFHFKQFDVVNRRSAMKVGTDGVLLGAWCSVPKTGHVVDVGCGTGLIAMMIAQRSPEVTITGVEIDEASASEAEANVEASRFAGRISIVHADFNDYVTSDPPILIVSNPPFFTEQLKAPDLTRATARHEGALGITSLMRRSREMLAPEGTLAMILPFERDDEALFEAALNGFIPLRQCHVVTVEGKAPRRTLWQFALEKSCSASGASRPTVLTIRHADGTFTDDYIKIVNDFYTKL